jgi:hypothetical protein
MRPHSLILSVGQQGVLIQLNTTGIATTSVEGGALSTGTTGVAGTTYGERIEWSASPNSLHRCETAVFLSNEWVTLIRGQCFRIETTISC